MYNMNVPYFKFIKMIQLRLSYFSEILELLFKLSLFKTKPLPFQKKALFKHFPNIFEFPLSFEISHFRLTLILVFNKFLCLQAV